MANPYQSLPKKAFWRPAVADRTMFEIDELWDPKLPIARSAPVATFGSCFAQHIGRALRSRGFNWHITEPAPTLFSPESAREFNYDVFTCRTGNIYTTSLLRQWTSWALGETTPPDEFWEKDGRIYDPFRPVVEPRGFASVEEMRQSRQATIEAFRRAIERSSTFVFTLGLTESWVNAAHGYEYPMCPGTAAGEFDAARHKFVNQPFHQIRDNLTASINMMRGVNKQLRFLLTVSPVPLTATYSGKHVLVATMHSKSVLRAVVGFMEGMSMAIDYFPSYEIINSPVFRGSFFEPNQRNVAQFGVDFVMDQFFRSLQRKFGAKAAPPAPAAAAPAPAASAPARPARRSADVVCEEELLEAFGS